MLTSAVESVYLGTTVCTPLTKERWSYEENISAYTVLPDLGAPNATALKWIDGKSGFKNMLHKNRLMCVINAPRLKPVKVTVAPRIPYNDARILKNVSWNRSLHTASTKVLNMPIPSLILSSELFSFPFMMIFLPSSSKLFSITLEMTGLVLLILLSCVYSCLTQEPNKLFFPSIIVPHTNPVPIRKFSFILNGRDTTTMLFAADPSPPLWYTTQ